MRGVIRARAKKTEVPQSGLFAFWDLRNLASSVQTVPSLTGSGGDLQFGPTTGVDANEPTKVGADGVNFVTAGGDLRSLTFPSMARPYTIGIVARPTEWVLATRSLLTLTGSGSNKFLIQRYSSGEFRVYHNPTGADSRVGKMDHLFRLYMIRVPASGSISIFQDNMLIGTQAGPTTANSTFDKLTLGNLFGGQVRALFVYNTAPTDGVLQQLHRSLVRLGYLEYLGELVPEEISRYGIQISGEYDYHGGQSLPIATDTAGKQYIGYVDASRNYRIGTRTRETDNWSVVDLSETRENPFELPYDPDGHNYVAMGVDGDGYIHLAGNHHDDFLHYARSYGAGDITRWKALRMIGTRETSVTYPAFLRLNDGRLLFMYRDGVSGLGDYLLNRYDPATQRWTRLHDPWISGDGESPYRSQVQIRADGTVHITFNYRPLGGQGSDNHDIHYIWSDNGGDTWKNAVGTVLPLPILQSSASLIWPVPPNSGFSLAAPPMPDSNGVLHTGYTRYDDTPQLADNGFHLWSEDGGLTWQEAQMTFWTEHYDSGQTGVAQHSGNAVVVEGNRLFNIIRDSAAYPDQYVAREITGGVFGPVFPIFLGADDLLGRPRDLQSPADGGEIRQFVTLANFYGGPASQFVPMWGQYVKYPGNYLTKLADGLIQPPGIIVKQSSLLPAFQAVSSTVDVATNTPALTIPFTSTRLMVRLKASTNLGTATTVTVSVKEGATVYGSLALVLGNVQQQTPWMPVRGTGLTVSAVVKVNAGSATLETATLEIGEWRD